MIPKSAKLKLTTSRDKTTHVTLLTVRVGQPVQQQWHSITYQRTTVSVTANESAIIAEPPATNITSRKQSSVFRYFQKISMYSQYLSQEIHCEDNINININIHGVYAYMQKMTK